ncbi:peptidoglycan-binding protein LysM [Gelidibacter salicanalis]|uniref:Peptidoglycan-binding protein LysM n=1 Tax=Gelidibacter salicanalis TaxID=291193 RepID=A0A934KSI0_9FLAO|nr:peptidoglycan-binding protein LysM [Gelidibacter salicanalis]MBJ7880601.1 peptidoglycan-binding protein LysM [Gelidibacter salicanalis]
MLKKITNYFVIPFAICVILMTALFPKTTVDMTNFSTEGLELNYTVSEDIAMLSPTEGTFPTITYDKYFPYLGKSYLGFKEALAFKESRGNYFTVNDFGYLGKYQFGAETLKLLGVYNPQFFLYTPELQEKAFLANSERNKWILRKDIARFVGKEIHGITITESGILAAAHLAGPGSVKKFLRSFGGYNYSDAYGSSISHYMKRFSGYDTSFIKPNRRAKAVL